MHAGSPAQHPRTRRPREPSRVPVPPQGTALTRPVSLGSVLSPSRAPQERATFASSLPRPRRPRCHRRSQLRGHRLAGRGAGSAPLTQHFLQHGEGYVQVNPGRVWFRPFPSADMDAFSIRSPRIPPDPPRGFLQDMHGLVPPLHPRPAAHRARTSGSRLKRSDQRVLPETPNPPRVPGVRPRSRAGPRGENPAGEVKGGLCCPGRGRAVPGDEGSSVAAWLRGGTPRCCVAPSLIQHPPFPRESSAGRKGWVGRGDPRSGQLQRGSLRSLCPQWGVPVSLIRGPCIPLERGYLCPCYGGVPVSPVGGPCIPIGRGSLCPLLGGVLVFPSEGSLHPPRKGVAARGGPCVL